MKYITIKPAVFFTGTAVKACATGVTADLNRGFAQMNVQLLDSDGKEVGHKNVNIPEAAYNAWQDDAQFLAEGVRAAGLTPIEPVAFL